MENRQTEKYSLILRSVMRVIAVVASLYGMGRYFSSMSLTYFTNLSNIFVDVMLIIFLVQDIMYRKTGKKRANGWYVAKFLATISITLTFLVYMFLLAPAVEGGLLTAYFAYGATSFCVHFLNPVLAILDYCLFDFEFRSSAKYSIYGVIPPLCYVGLVLIWGACGIRWGVYKMMAPYNFLNYGAKTGWFGFEPSGMSAVTLGIGVFYMIVILVILFIGIGLAFLKIKNLRQKRMLGKR